MLGNVAIARLAARIWQMGKGSKKAFSGATDLCSLEADMAFFEARLSLAGEAPDTVYQRAQIKTYQTLGTLIGDTIGHLRPEPAVTPASNGDGQAATC